MNATDYLRARAKIDQEHRNKIRSLDDVWTLLNDGTPPPQPIENHDGAVITIRGEWRVVARQVIDEMPSGSTLTVRDVENGINTKNPMIATDKVAISIFLKKLADDKELKIIEAGAGRRATIYGKK
jgi:hypothetical protein